MLSQLNLNGGEIIFENISTYTESPFQENLLFIKYGKRYCVDVDWNPLALPQGFFFIRVIEDCDWDEPLLELKVTTFNQIMEATQKAIYFIVKYMEENPNAPTRESSFD